MLVDSHCHLDLIKNSDPDTLVSNAQAQGVTHFLSVSIDLDHFPRLLGIAQRINNVFASVGIHPNSSPDLIVEVSTLTNLADDPNVIAIGETGLDYFRSIGDLTWQQQRFRTHIQAAKEIGKPLIIHSRNAISDTLRILREEKAADVGGIMHCFVEDWEVAQQVMNMPLNVMLVETDSPYLAPVPYRGKTNYPAYVKQVAEFIAKLRNESFETIARVTTENFFRLF